MITSQVPVDRWHELIGVPTLADAMLDHVVHNAYRRLAGESLGKRPFSILRPRACATAARPTGGASKAVDKAATLSAMKGTLRPLFHRSPTVLTAPEKPNFAR